MEPYNWKNFNENDQTQLTKYITVNNAIINRIIIKSCQDQKIYESAFKFLDTRFIKCVIIKLICMGNLIINKNTLLNENFVENFKGLNDPLVLNFKQLSIDNMEINFRQDKLCTLEYVVNLFYIPKEVFLKYNVYLKNLDIKNVDLNLFLNHLFKKYFESL